MLKNYILSAMLAGVAAAVFILAGRSGQLYRAYRAEVLNGLKRVSKLEKSLLLAEDIQPLPEPLQKYLRYAGVIGREKVNSFQVVAEGEMKMDPQKGWVKIRSEQHNFVDSQLSRLFFMQVKIFGLPVIGLHTYTDDQANMLIRVAGLFTVLDAGGPEMRIGDTTTLFNDMCFFAPAALIDSRIQWSTIDPLTVKGIFTNGETQVSAILYFNQAGELINFVSDDRYYIPLDGSRQQARWSTPIGRYRERDGYKLATYGEAVWQLPEGDYCYAKFNNIKTVIYNQRLL